MGLLIVIGFAVFCIFFLVALIFSAWHWRWLNIVAMLFLFPVAVAFVILFSNVMEKNFAARGTLNKLEKDLATTVTENQELQVGPAEQVEWTSDSVIGYTHRLETAALGRGRVWRDCVPGQIQRGKVDVTTFVAGAELPDGTRPKVFANNIKAPSLVYVFAQGPPTPDGLSFPRTYLGEFRVTEATDTTVSLEQSLVLDERELKAAQGMRWTLYELMPADMRNVFEIAEAPINSDDFSMDVEAKRNLLTSKYMTPASIGLKAEDEAYNRLVNRYVFDGMPIGEIAKLDPDFAEQISDDETYVRVKVIKNFDDAQSALDKKVDSDVVNNNISQSRDFDEQGNAEADALKNNGPVDIKPGDELEVDLKTAVKGYTDPSGNIHQSWVDRGLVEEIERIYRRTLNDYGTVYHDVTLALELIKLELAFQESNNQIQLTSEGLTDEENVFREDLRDGLEADNLNLMKDVGTVDAALAKTSEMLEANKSRLEELDEIIADATSKLAEFEARWAREADRRTMEATNASFTTP